LTIVLATWNQHPRSQSFRQDADYATSKASDVMYERFAQASIETCTGHCNMFRTVAHKAPVIELNVMQLRTYLLYKAWSHYICLFACRPACHWGSHEWGHGGICPHRPSIVLCLYICTQFGLTALPSVMKIGMLTKHVRGL